MAATLFLLPSPTNFLKSQSSKPPYKLVQTTILRGSKRRKEGTKLGRLRASVILEAERKNEVKILVAGGGIGGLVFALAAKRKGFGVLVFEKDSSVVRGEGNVRGPIQIQSNALAVLEAIDLAVAEEVLAAGCVIGDKVNGLVDGISGDWFMKLDTFTPATKRGLPLTRVISRMKLQQILANAIGEDNILLKSKVVNFEDHGYKVTIILENGKHYDGDLLVGADGIRSTVRRKLYGPKDAIYSGYTCYSGITDFVAIDIESVGFRVFLGHNRYFVPLDIGSRKMQWYAFNREPPDGVDVPHGRKERVLKIFEGWCDDVVDLILATEEEAILRRDIYDLSPPFSWGRGRVTLLGDSVHAMQPNFSQGGGMAIEDSYQLALELDKAWKTSVQSGVPVDVISSLNRYERARRLRVTMIHGLVRMASMMVSIYRPYLGVKLGPLPLLMKHQILHLTRLGARFLVDFVMQLVFSLVIGGYSSKLEGRPLCCRLSDKANDQLRRCLKGNEALEHSINGEWLLVPFGNNCITMEPVHLKRDDKQSCIIGCERHEHFRGTSVVIPSKQVSKMHACISYKDGAFFLIDLWSKHGTYIVNKNGKRHRVTDMATQVRRSDVIEFGSDNKATFRVKVMRSLHDT